MSEISMSPQNQSRESTNDVMEEISPTTAPDVSMEDAHVIETTDKEASTATLSNASPPRETVDEVVSPKTRKRTKSSSLELLRSSEVEEMSAPPRREVPPDKAPIVNEPSDKNASTSANKSVESRRHSRRTSNAPRRETSTALGPPPSRHRDRSSSSDRRSEKMPASSSSRSTEVQERERAQFDKALKATSPDIAQESLRKNWRVFLFEKTGGGSNDEHLSFILRAGLKNSSESVLNRVFKEQNVFKDALVNVSSKKQAVVDRVLKNATTQQLTDLVPEDTLDRVVADYLKNVSAKKLIRWLAEANRLGYTLDDNVDGDEVVMPKIPATKQNGDSVGDIQSRNGSERPSVAPSEYSTAPSHYSGPPPRFSHAPPEHPMAHSQYNTPPPYATSMGQQQQDRGRYQNVNGRMSSDPGDFWCPVCHFKFPNQLGFNFHISKRICAKGPPDWNTKAMCEYCNQTFTTTQGLNYHQLKKVCQGGETPAPRPQSPSRQLQQEATTEVPRNASMAVMPVHSPPVPYTQPAPPPPPPSYNSGRRSTGAVPRPPLHTPDTPTEPRVIIAHDGTQVRQSPSELDPSRLAALNKALDEVETKYQQAIASIPADATPEDRERRMTSLKNGNASRKSQIRKSFGVTLRMREKDKIALALANGKKRKESPNRFNDYRAPPPIRPDHTQNNIIVPTTGFSPINGSQNRRAASASYPPQSGGPGVTAQGSPYPDRGTPPVYQNPPVRTRSTANPPGSATSTSPSGLGFPPPARPTSQPLQTSPHFPPDAIINQAGEPMATEEADKMETRAAKRNSVGGAASVKKVPVGKAQAKWEALQPRSKNTAGDAGPSSAAVEGVKKQVEVVNLDSSGEEDDKIVVDNY